MDVTESNESFVGAEPFLWNRLKIAAMVGVPRTTQAFEVLAGCLNGHAWTVFIAPAYGFQQDVGVHHCPDVFQVQYEISLATSLALKRHCDTAQASLHQAQAQYQQKVDASQAFEQKWPSTRAELRLSQRPGVGSQPSKRDLREPFQDTSRGG